MSFRASSEGLGQHVEISAGAYWVPLPEVIAYEASIPLTYVSSWNSEEVRYESKKHNCNSNNSDWVEFCSVINHLDKMSAAVDTEFFLLSKNWNINTLKNISLSAKQNRMKRSIEFIGDFASFCCNIATQKKLDSLVMNENDLQQQMDKINSGLGKTLKAVSDNSHNFEILNKQFSESFRQTEEKIQQVDNFLNDFQITVNKREDEIFQLLWILLDFELKNNKRFIQIVRELKQLEITNSCKKNLIPTSVISPKVLHADLQKLRSELTTVNQDLAIPLKSLAKMYQLPICDCALVNNNLVVHIKVPIIQMNRDWELFELAVAPFKWHNETCLIDHDTLYVAVTENKFTKDTIRQISGMGLHNCQPYRDTLCYIPRFACDTLQGPTCARKLYYGDTVEQIAKHCTMRCHKSTATVISEIDEATFVVTHAKRGTVIKCQDKNYPISEPLIEAPGAIKIRLPCSCDLYEGNVQLIPKRFPCPKDASKNVQLTHVLPAIWTNIHSFVLNPLSKHSPPTYKNITEILDTNWTVSAPHINITSTQDTINEVLESIHSKPPIHGWSTEYSFHGNTIILVWNTIISIVLIYLFCHRNPMAIVPAFPNRVSGLGQSQSHHDILLGLFYGILISIVLYCIIRKLFLFCKNKKSKSQTQTAQLDTENPLSPQPSNAASDTHKYILEIDSAQNLLTLSKNVTVACSLREYPDS